MKKLLSMFCTLLLISMVSISAFAGPNDIELNGRSSSTSQNPINFNIKECSAKLRYTSPSFENPEADLDQTVFFSSKGSITLDSTNNWIKNGYISVRIKEPKLKRSFNLLHPTTFCKKVPEDANVNRFYIQGPRLKAPFWHPIKKLKYWWNPQYITINYGLAVTDKNDERVYEQPRLEKGMKTKAQKDKEALKAAIKEKNPEDKSSNNKSFFEPFDFRLKKKEPEYYTDEMAKKENIENEKKREEFRRKLANLNKEEMFIEGEIARLTPDNPVCNFRLVINNNEGLNADRLALLISAQGKENISFADSSKLDLEFVYVYPLPERLKSAKEDASTLKGILNPNQDSRVKLVRDMNSAMNLYRIPLLSSMLETVRSKYSSARKKAEPINPVNSIDVSKTCCEGPKILVKDDESVKDVKAIDSSDVVEQSAGCNKSDAKVEERTSDTEAGDISVSIEAGNDEVNCVENGRKDQNAKGKNDKNSNNTNNNNNKKKNKKKNKNNKKKRNGRNCRKRR